MTESWSQADLRQASETLEGSKFSFGEEQMLQQIPDWKRGDNFESFVAQEKVSGKSEKDILLDLGFKHLVKRLETPEDVAKVLQRAIEAAQEAKKALKTHLPPSSSSSSTDPIPNTSSHDFSKESPESSPHSSEEFPDEPQKSKTHSGSSTESRLANFFGSGIEEEFMEDEEDDDYDPTDVMLKNDSSDGESKELILTDPVAILGVISSQLRRNEDNFDPRRKLDHIHSEEDAIREISKAQKILVLSGAGISVACGVPDFRSPGGLYDQIKEKYELPDPQMLFDIGYLRQNQVPFYDFAAQLFPSSELIPSKAHRFIKLLEEKGKLLRNYSQNIDTLEQQVGIDPEKLVLCHGSFATFSCPEGHKVDGSMIKSKLDSKYIPQCEVCNDSSGQMFLKPDIVFFGEQLPDKFSSLIVKDVKEADLLIVMGSSLRVQPVALVPRLMGDVAPQTPQLLLNRELVAQPHQFDHAFLSNIDTTVERICESLGWEL